MPSYTIHLDTLVTQGPFRSNEDIVEAVNSIDEDEVSEHIVVETDELGNITVENAEDWLIANGGDDDED